MIADLRAKAQIWVDVGDADKHDMAVAYLAAMEVVDAAREVYDQHFLKRVNVGRGSFEHAYNDLRDALARYQEKQS